MAFTSVGNGGTGQHSTSASSFSYTQNGGFSVNASDNHFMLLTVVTDNSSSVDGDNNEHTSITGGTGTWSKLAEYTNSNGAAAAGCTTSLWLFMPSGNNPLTTAFTINLASAVTDKVASGWVFSKSANTLLRIDTETSVQTSQVDAGNDFGSSSFSALGSRPRLYFRALGKEANSNTALTVSANFTTITAARSRNNANAVLVRGEFRINTSTGETSNPTLAVSGDTAGLFVALEEVIRGSIAATETGSDTASLAGNVLVQGVLAVTEGGQDVASLAGNVLVRGTMDASEAGQDTCSILGVVVGTMGLAISRNVTIPASERAAVLDDAMRTAVVGAGRSASAPEANRNITLPAPRRAA